jgi:hypothetical protein
MPSDRGTLPRGLAGSAEQVPIWPEPTAPAGRRLPSAPRERKPALAALAVLLILGGALGASFLVIQSGQRVAAIEISQPIGAGQQIPPSAVQQVQIASGTGLSFVPWDQAGQVTRFYAVSAIPPGTLLTSGMVASTGTSTAGRAVLGLALKDGQLPRGLQDGDHVAIYQVSNAQESCPGTAGSMLAADAVVLAIGTPSVTSGSSALADVEVAVNPAEAGAVACNAANGMVGIAVLPSGGAGAGSPGAAGHAPSRRARSAGQPGGGQKAGSQTAPATASPGTASPGTGSPGTASPGTASPSTGAGSPGTGASGSGVGSASPSPGGRAG